MLYVWVTIQIEVKEDKRLFKKILKQNLATNKNNLNYLTINWLTFSIQLQLMNQLLSSIQRKFKTSLIILRNGSYNFRSGFERKEARKTELWTLRQNLVHTRIQLICGTRMKKSLRKSTLSKMTKSLIPNMILTKRGNQEFQKLMTTKNNSLEVKFIWNIQIWINTNWLNEILFNKIIRKI